MAPPSTQRRFLSPPSPLAAAAASPRKAQCSTRPRPPVAKAPLPPLFRVSGDPEERRVRGVPVLEAEVVQFSASRRSSFAVTIPCVRDLRVKYITTGGVPDDEGRKAKEK